jgi:hypothetical protein
MAYTSKVSAPLAGVSISIRGLEEVQAMLAKVADPKQANKVLQAATAAGGNAIRAAVLNEMPGNAPPGYRGHAAGDLRRSLWVRRAKRQRPATIVGHHNKIAFWWGILIVGARPHKIRFPNQKAAGVQRSSLNHGIVGGGNIAHPGLHANPFVSRAAVTGQPAAMAAVEKVVSDYLASL